MHATAIRYSTMHTHLGPLLLACTVRGLCQVQFIMGSRLRKPQPHWQEDDLALDLARDALQRYFDGKSQQFDLPLDPEGTSFQHAVWHALREIPCGATRTYAQIAQAIGNPTAVRAVASANASNPIAIIVPCHRVIGSDGKLRGYAGGLTNKAALLDHESRLYTTADASD